MRLQNWLDVLKSSSIWIFLLAINYAFFMFLAWVAYPEAFKLLVGMMLIFSIGSVVLGIFFTWKKQKKQEALFYTFLREPSPEHESAFIQSIGVNYKEQVHHLADKLRMLTDQLDDIKLQSLDYEEFIESWVHEIKTPISLVNFVLQNRQDEMSTLVYQRLEHAKIAIHEHVEQILFYARLQAPHIDYQFEKISLTDCFEDVLLELQALLDEEEMEVDLQVEDVPMVSDERALQFIFIQIILNAVKYANGKTNRLISLQTGFDNVKDRYYIKISDNGLGVLRSDLPFIFDKGFTGDHPQRKQSTGIGLYLVKKLCDDLQLEIDVGSTYEKGFSIQFTFPANDDKPFAS